MVALFKKTMLVLLVVLLVVGTMPMAVFAADDAGQIVIACVGDSITQGIGSTSPTTNSYPAQLQKQLGDRYQVVNCGMSGSTLMVENGAPNYRMYDPYKLSLECNPDVVIIMLGTNDSKSRYWAYKDRFVAQMVNLVKEYQELKSKPTVYIATSAYVPIDLDGITDAVVTNEVVPLQKNAARRAKCEVIDINAFTQGHADWFLDGVHPTNDGYAKIAEYFADFISERHDAPIVSELVDRLNKLPKTLTKNDISEVETLLFLFERLTPRQQKFVTNEQRNKLNNAKQAIENLQNPVASVTTTTTTVPSKNNSTQQTALTTTSSLTSDSTLQPTESTQSTESTSPVQSTQSTQSTPSTQSAQSDQQSDSKTEETRFPWAVIPVAFLLIAGIVGLVLWLHKKKKTGS